MEYLSTREDRLGHFFAGYLNQDWELLYQNEFEAADAFATDHLGGTIEGENLLELFIRDLEWLIETHRGRPSDELWETLTETHGSYYTGQYIGQEAKRWLESLIERFRRAKSR